MLFEENFISPKILQISFTFCNTRSNVLVRKYLRHGLPCLRTALHIPAAHLMEQHVHQVELRYTGRHRAALEGPLQRAALKHYVGIGRTRDLGNRVTRMATALRSRMIFRFFSSSSVEPE